VNYIKRLERDLRTEQNRNRQMRERIKEVEAYLLSPKFHEEDYVYVRTDMLPKLDHVLFGEYND